MVFDIVVWVSKRLFILGVFLLWHKPIIYYLSEFTEETKRCEQPTTTDVIMWRTYLSFKSWPLKVNHVVKNVFRSGLKAFFQLTDENKYADKAIYLTACLYTRLKDFYETGCLKEVQLTQNLLPYLKLLTVPGLQVVETWAKQAETHKVCLIVWEVCGREEPARGRLNIET